MIHHSLCSFALLVSFAVSGPAADARGSPPLPAVRVPVAGLSQPRKLTLLAAQGLANRSGPNVYLEFGADNAWMELHYEEKPGQQHLQAWNPATPESFKIGHPTLTEAWMDVWGRGVFDFTVESWEAFLAGTKAGGWIVYDQFEDEVALVGTLAGQFDALPVLREDLPAMERIAPGLPIVFDAASIPASPGVGRKVAVHRWMVDHMLPRVNKAGLVSRVRSYNLAQHDTFTDIDQAVQEKWLVYDLTHYREDTADKPDPRFSRPDESQVLGLILSAYPPLTPVFGWGAIDENTFVRTVTEKGLTVICSGVPNNSFFNRWRAAALPLRQRHPPLAADGLKVEKKIHLAFMVNEGDSIKDAIALQGHAEALQLRAVRRNGVAGDAGSPQEVQVE